MASILKVDELQGIVSAGDITVTSEGGSATQSLQQGLAKAWVNFNGTSTVAIRESGNVSSITDNGTGYYTVNFTTAMPDANYSAVASCFQSGSVLLSRTPISASTASYAVITATLAGADADSTFIATAAFR